jgi:DnaJ-class molecular chaperone
MADDAKKAEILVIAGLIASMDYYQVLKVDRKAIFPEIKKAFFRESQAWHPDRFYSSTDEELKLAVMAVYKRIAEAYAALRDPQLRHKYDAQLAGGGANRLDRKEAAAAASGAPAADPKAKNPLAQKYLTLGLSAFRKGDFAGAVMNLDFALKYEPANEGISKKLAEAKEKQKAKAASDPKDPYKIM